MSESHTVARDFFAALSTGSLPEDLLADDFRAWTVTSQAWSDGARYRGGVAMLGSVFDGSYRYKVLSLTAEEDRVAAEVSGSGTLLNGEAFANEYLFLLRVADGKVAEVREFFDPAPVRERLAPLFTQGGPRG